MVLNLECKDNLKLVNGYYWVFYLIKSKMLRLYFKGQIIYVKKLFPAFFFLKFFVINLFYKNDANFK